MVVIVAGYDALLHVQAHVVKARITGSRDAPDAVIRHKELLYAQLRFVSLCSTCLSSA